MKRLKSLLRIIGIILIFHSVGLIPPILISAIYHDGQIVYQDDILFLKTKTKLVIEPINDHEAIILCLGSKCHETIHFKTKDGHELLEYAGLKYKKNM